MVNVAIYSSTMDPIDMMGWLFQTTGPPAATGRRVRDLQIPEVGSIYHRLIQVTRPGKRFQKTMERSTMFNGYQRYIGISTISTGPFSIAMLVYQRVIQMLSMVTLFFQILQATFR